MKPKKWPILVPKAGWLQARWGRLPYDSPDLVFLWGSCCPKADAMLLQNVLGGYRARVLNPAERRTRFGSPLTYDRSLLDEFKARGYDVETLKFSIQQQAADARLTQARRRWTPPVAQPNELKVQWGRTDDGSPGLCFVYGDQCNGVDITLLRAVFTHQRPALNYGTHAVEQEASFIDELASRNYDLTTLKFSIQKIAG